MSILRFDSDDAAYLLWLQHNPNGFVINTKRTVDRGSAVFHTAHCTHIRTVRSTEKASGFTQGEWIKFCSNDRSVLMQHYAAVSKASTVTLVRCRSCSPIPSDITFERVHHADQHAFGGRVTHSFSNPHEGDPYLRAICLEHHGARCAACGVDMSIRYGALGKGFMDVHDTTRPGKDASRSFDPLRDLVPVCPNCHVMLHRGRKVPLTIEELRRVIRRALIGWSESIY
jgi:predicted HNH restriction endonuclease